MRIRFAWSSTLEVRETEQVELALKEGNIPHKYYSVNLSNKPAFLTEQINPIEKVPAIAYGGSDVPPEEPSHSL